jgi:hypothetical protein
MRWTRAGKRLAIGAVVVACVVPGGPDAALAVRVLEYESRIEGDPPLQQPVSLSLDPMTGSVCVTDQRAHCLDVFDRAGFHRFRTDATSGISLPLGACIDANGDFVFTDTSSGTGRTIRRLNFLGEPLEYEPEIPRESWTPGHLSLAANGDYLAVDRSALLTRHDPGGALVWAHQLVDEDWEGRDLLGRPVEAPDGTILVPGATLGRVVLVTADGKPGGGFGLPGTKRGEMAFPMAVAVGPQGDVLVLDRMRHKVLLYDPAYEFVDEFGRLGYRPGDLYYPLAMVAAPDGRVFISQGFEGRVQIYRLFETADVMAFPGDFRRRPTP